MRATRLAHLYLTEEHEAKRSLMKLLIIQASGFSISVQHFVTKWGVVRRLANP
jgi:hypothetical protein